MRALTEPELVERAAGGDKASLEEIIGLLQDPLYRLSLRMVWRPEDAEDATQEILVKVLTQLKSWRNEAKLLTWAYRIGINHLLNLKRQSPQEQRELSFSDMAEDLADGLAAVDYRGPEAVLLADEVRLSCTQAMLQCLGREERVAFVLDEIFELTGSDAAWILGINPAAYRKRLERARFHLREFMSQTCGLVNADAACRCRRRVAKAVALGRVDARKPVFAGHAVTPGGRTVAEARAQLESLHDAASVLRAHPDYAAPNIKLDTIQSLLKSESYPLLNGDS